MYSTNALFLLVTEADLTPIIQAITPEGNAIVRGLRNSAALELTLQLQHGSSFPAVDSPRTNYNLTVLLSAHTQPDLTCQGAWEECHAMPVVALWTEEVLQSGINTTISPNVTFSGILDVLVTPEQCHEVQYICVLLAEGSGASYLELNSRDNLQCQNISPMFLCKPGIVPGMRVIK